MRSPPIRKPRRKPRPEALIWTSYRLPVAVYDRIRVVAKRNKMSRGALVLTLLRGCLGLAGDPSITPKQEAP